VPSKLFQKRKAAAKLRAEREAKQRAEQVRVLLVNEGSKTEPNYFVEFFRLDGGSRVEPFATRDHNTSPTALLNQAKEILSKDSDFDLAFVVGDRDEFPDFEQARNAANQINTQPKIRYIYSDPCFELWLVLHFVLWDAPVDRHAIRAELEGHMDAYSKGDTSIARQIYERTDEAIENAKALRQRMEKSGSTCPSTLVDQLVEEVREAAAQKLAE